MKVKYTVLLNNDQLPVHEVKKIFKSVQNKRILNAKGGFLFKSSITGSTLHLGILPVLIEGERTHHYDIKLDFQDEYNFTGFFNVDGSLGILFTPPGKKDVITDNFKKGLKEAYYITAEAFIEYGFSKKMELDWISRKMIGEIGIYEEIPGNLKELGCGS